jgi:adenylate cyclase
MPPLRRRAIVFADLVESVRLMERHETDAIERWRRFVAVVREQLMPTLGGRLVRTAGDGLLLEFERASGAVAASLALHEALSPLNQGREPEDQMLLRVAVHCCEVTFDEHEVYGHGVNLAARLAALAPPGATVVSDTVRDELVDGVHGDIEDLGLRYLKHMKEPVRAFVVRPVGRADVRTRLPVPATDEMRPCIAVVPFVAMPADPIHDALGHAVADDIIAAIARHPGLRVLSRASTSAVQNMTLAPLQLHQALGASFMLSGRYYMLGTRVRLNVELCNLKSGEVLWTDSATDEVQAFFAGHDQLVPRIVANVSQQVLAHELTRVRSLPMNTLASYTLFLGAEGLMNNLQRSDFERAAQVLEHLIERHPRQAAPYALKARWHVFKTVQGWSEDTKAESRAAQVLAHRAMDIDPRQSLALTVDGLTRMHWDDDADAARERYLAAIAADPVQALAWTYLVAVHSLTGEHEQARAAAAQALSVSPLDPSRYLFESFAAMAALGGGHFDDAVLHAQSSVRHHALHAPSHRLLVAALWLAGRHDDARSAVPRYLATQPQARALVRRKTPPGRQPVWWEVFGKALLAAGVPP